MGPKVFAIAAVLFCITATSALADIEYVLLWQRPSGSATGVECRFQEWISDATGRHLNGWIHFDRKGVGHFTPNTRLSRSVHSPRAERAEDASNVIDLDFARTSLKRTYGSLLRTLQDSESVIIHFPNNPKGYLPVVEATQPNEEKSIDAVEDVAAPSIR